MVLWLPIAVSVVVMAPSPTEAPTPTGPSASTEAVPPEGSQPLAGPREVAGQPSMISEDVEPSVTLVTTDRAQIRLGALVQTHAAPYVGQGALIANGDVASNGGFRVRRARLGIEGRFQEKFGLFLTANLVEDGGSEVISDAKVTYEVVPSLQLSLGSGKLPFSKASLTSSRRLVGIERPLTSNALSPNRRIGLTAEGVVAGGRFAYLAAVTNATEGFALGNQFGGLLVGARGELRLSGAQGASSGLAAGASAFYEDGPSVQTVAGSADLTLAFRNTQVLVEAICDRRSPASAPTTPPAVADTTERCGGYAEVSFRIPGARFPLYAAGRAEIFDDNLRVQDAGDAVLYDVGINADLPSGYARAQLHYLGRIERFGPSIPNDALVLAVQGSF